MFLRHPLLASIGVDHGFGTLESQGRPACHTLRQTHGTQILALSQSPNGSAHFSGDGLIADDGGEEIGVWTADCLPVLISSDSGSHVGAFHAGWRGAVAGIAVEGLHKMMELSGLPASRFKVVLGPSIGPCCFEVGSEVWDAVRARTSTFRSERKDVLDLWGLVTHQLLLEGVPEHLIGRVSLCTRCHPDLFYSHRGWGSKREGRSMLNYIRPTGHDRT